MQTSKLRLSALATLLAAACFCSSRAEVIDDVLGSLSKGAAFLERQHQHINLDGVVGFLMLQGAWGGAWGVRGRVGVLWRSVCPPAHGKQLDVANTLADKAILA